MLSPHFNNSNPPTPPTQDDINEFCAAGKGGDVEALKRMLDKFGKSIINGRDNGQDSALTWAAWYGHKDTVAFLLDRGADIEGPGMHNQTALIWAAKGGRKDTVKLLLERGANVEARDHEGNTALSLSERNSQAEVAKIIREWVETKRQDAETKRQEEEARAATRERLDMLKKQAPKIKLPPRTPGK